LLFEVLFLLGQPLYGNKDRAVIVIDVVGWGGFSVAYKTLNVSFSKIIRSGLKYTLIYDKINYGY